MGFLTRGKFATAIAVAAATVAVPFVANASSVPPCGGSQLRIDKAGQQGFTSHVELILALRNVSPTTCRVSGYPRITLLDANARSLPTKVVHRAGAKPVVVLKPWRRAFFTFTYTTNGPCSKAVFAYGARVSVRRADSGTVWYAGRFGLCGPAPAQVTISPVGPKRQF